MIVRVADLSILPPFMAPISVGSKPHIPFDGCACRYEQQLQTQRMRLVSDGDMRMEQLEMSRCAMGNNESRHVGGVAAGTAVATNVAGSYHKLFLFMLLQA